MANKEFDEKFRELFTNMVEIAFEYVNRNKEEVDTVYIFASMEAGDFFYNVFYEINGKLTEIHKINTVSKQQYDISDERVFRLLKQGNNFLEETAKAFKEDNRQVPTLMRMVYSPKTGGFDNEISYELFYSNDDEKTILDVFNEWFGDIENIRKKSLRNNAQ